MLKANPTQLDHTQKLAAAIEWTPGVERVVFSPDRPLPDTKDHYGPLRIVCSEDSRHIASLTHFYQLTTEALKHSVAGLVKGFRDYLVEHQLQPKDFAPLPHAGEWGQHVYQPAVIDGVPVRFILCYDLSAQQWAIACDAYAHYT